MVDSEIFLGRQPILDTNLKIIGYEILFRSEYSKGMHLSELTQASADAILNTLTNFGLNRVIDLRHHAFFKVNKAILMDEMLELLPKEQVIIELVALKDIDHILLNRIKILKGKGFSFALGSFEPPHIDNPIYDEMDIVKIDFKTKDIESIKETVRQFGRRPVQLLAEHVEDTTQLEAAKTLGFAMFQGYFFSHPELISGKKIEHGNVVVLRLINQMFQDVGLSEVEKTFRESATLTYNLLRLVNSVSSGVREKITSVRHALVMLGRDRLQRWAQVLLFANKNIGEQNNPLLTTAAMRGRFMELMVEKGAIGGVKPIADRAFMTGILSLLDSLLGKPMKEVLEGIELEDAVVQALLFRGGDLGQLLSLVEVIESSHEKKLEPLSGYCRIDRHHLFEAEQEATIWTKRLTSVF
ncbi:MAG: EAL and HDOD domain-containing protein [Nitrospiria bacterium]